MKRLTILFLCFTNMVLPLSAQLRMADVLKAMPVENVPYLTENSRLDMIDFLDANMKAEVRNRFDGKSQLLRLTTDYLQLRLNEASQMEMRLLDRVEQGDTIVCVVHTYGVDVRESIVRFYTPDWQPLSDSALLQVPPLTERPDTMTAERYAALQRLLIPHLLVAHLSADAPELSLTLDLPYMSADEREEVKAILLKKILKWNGKTFN